jgi:hypothetical protein
MIGTLEIEIEIENDLSIRLSCLSSAVPFSTQ